MPTQTVECRNLDVPCSSPFRGVHGGREPGTSAWQERLPEPHCPLEPMLLWVSLPMPQLEAAVLGFAFSSFQTGLGLVLILPQARGTWASVFRAQRLHILFWGQV